MKLNIWKDTKKKKRVEQEGEEKLENRQQTAKFLSIYPLAWTELPHDFSSSTVGNSLEAVGLMDQ